jgi:hypothetical protein
LSFIIQLFSGQVQLLIFKGGKTAIFFFFLVCWSTAQRTTEMLADQQTGKNIGPAPADYRNWASAIPLFWILAYFKNFFKTEEILNNGVDTELNIY